MSSDSNYEKLSDELQNKINTELFDGNGFKDNAIRRIAVYVVIEISSRICMI